MKKIIPVLLIFCLIFTSCSFSATDETTTGQPETTTEAPVTYINPLNGEKLDAPYDGRVFSVTINNVSPAIPHHGVSQADIYFEMFINDYCTRGLALFSDVRKVDAIGSIRSTRYNFTDIVLAYNTIHSHANGSKAVLKDMNDAGVDNMLADIPIGFRDEQRRAAGYSYEHTLFAKGQSLYDAAQEKGFALTSPGKSYGMNFSDEVILSDGTDANEIEIIFTLFGRTKTSVMKYNTASDKYTYWQYKKEMTDGNTNMPEEFKNVFVLLAPTENQDVYHVANLYGTGDGYFACGGKIKPIRWTHINETDPFTFTYTDGTPVIQETGNSYIAIAPTGSPVNW